MSSFIRKYCQEIHDKSNAIDQVAFENAASLLGKIRCDAKKVLIVGNGGSAAMASHVTVDFLKVAQIRAVNFNDSDLITCFANDYGYENWVSNALENYGDRGDLLIAISSSGMSQNILNAVHKAREMGLKCITFSGFKPDNNLNGLGDINFWVPSSKYNVVEMVHHIWLLALVDYHAK